MAKGEGGEQYSNASLLNKPVSSDGIKLARKVSSFIDSYFIFYERFPFSKSAHLAAQNEGEAGF